MVAAGATLILGRECYWTRGAQLTTGRATLLLDDLSTSLSKAGKRVGSTFARLGCL